MIHTTDNFFNKVAADIRVKYFKDEVHGTTENKGYHAATNAIELFSNGCLTYRQLIGRLGKACNDSGCNIHSIVQNHVVSFGQYKYKPSKKNNLLN